MKKPISYVEPPGILIANDRALALSSNGHQFAYNNFLGTFANTHILVADGTTAATKAKFAGHKDRVDRLVISGNGKLIASGSLNGLVKLWEIETEALRFDLAGHSAAVSAMAFSPKNEVLATGGWDQQIILWDTASGREIGRLRGHFQSVTSIAFSPDGGRICSTSRDGTVRVWKAESSDRPANLLTNSPFVFSTQFSPAGDWFTAFDGNDYVKVWDPTNLVQIGGFRIPDEVAEKITVGPGGLVANQLTNNYVAIYNVHPFSKLVELRDRTNAVRALAFSRNGRFLAVARDDWPQQSAYTVGVWDWQAQKEIAHLNVHPSWVMGMGFSRDANLVGIGHYDGLVEVWRISDSTLVATFQGAWDRANRVLFLSDARRVVCASGNSGVIRIWDLHRQQESAALSGQVTAYSQVSESVDGRLLAASGCDGTITIWDLQSYAEVASIRGHPDCILTLAFLPDGNTLTSISRESIRVWHAAPFEETDAEPSSQENQP